MNQFKAFPIIAAIFLAACDDGQIADTSVTAVPPEGAPPGTCWAQQIKPAVVETQTVHKAMPDKDGVIVYQTETTQTIVEDRQEVWFEVPCQRVMTAEFIASLQRALKARGYYVGPITGKMDDATSKAIRLMQSPLGIDSQVLSLLGARYLGLVATPVK